MAFKIKIKYEELLKNYHPGIAIDRNGWSTNSETIFPSHTVQLFIWFLDIGTIYCFLMTILLIQQQTLPREASRLYGTYPDRRDICFNAINLTNLSKELPSSLFDKLTFLSRYNTVKALVRGSMNQRPSNANSGNVQFQEKQASV